MFGFEIRKYLQSKMIIFVFIGMLFIKLLVSYFSLNISVPYKANLYEKYLVTWDGILDNTKATEIEKEKERLEYIINNFSIFEEQYHNGEMEFEEFYEYVKENDIAKAEYEAFMPVYSKYQYFQMTDEHVEFFYDLEILEFVKLFNKDIILVLLLCVILSIITDMDNSKELYAVIKSQPEGRKKFIITKILGVAFISGIVTMLFVGVDFVIYACRYSFENWDRTIYSIQSMSSFCVNSTATGVFAILSVVKILLMVIMGELIFIINKLSKRLFLSIFISVIIFVVFTLAL